MEPFPHLLLSGIMVKRLFLDQRQSFLVLFLVLVLPTLQGMEPELNEHSASELLVLPLGSGLDSH